jgi:hypothetical protein
MELTKVNLPIPILITLLPHNHLPRRIKTYWLLIT